jgi:hypothetical protein
MSNEALAGAFTWVGWAFLPNVSSPLPCKVLAERPTLTEWNAVCYEPATGLLL